MRRGAAFGGVDFSGCQRGWVQHRKISRRSWLCFPNIFGETMEYSSIFWEMHRLLKMEKSTGGVISGQSFLELSQNGHAES